MTSLSKRARDKVCDPQSHQAAYEAAVDYFGKDLIKANWASYRFVE